MSEAVVSVCCITFNHEKYVRQCLEGLVHQKTSFPYEIIIHDDASTDGTAAVINEYAERYPDRIKTLLQKENQYSRGFDKTFLSFLLPEATGKYLAICEGDDYWCDEHKLEKQFQAMETNENCSVCTHRTKIVSAADVPTGALLPAKELETILLNGESYLKYIAANDKHLFHTSSIFIRMQCMEEVRRNVPDFMKVSKVEDRLLFLYLSTKGDCIYLDEVMSAYRIMSEGSWSSNMVRSRRAFYENTLDMMEMMRRFDRYTGRQYHDEIEQGMKIYRFRKYQYEFNCKELIKPEYRELYGQLSGKDKIYYRLCARLPFLGIAYRNLKKRMKGGEQ